MGEALPKSDQFSRNLRFLLRTRWMSQREASDQIGVPYKWLRRLCHHGLDRIDKRSTGNLVKLAEFFAVGLEDLWGTEIEIVPRANWVLIKWIGSKRRLAPEILRRFPTKIKTYWEPFVGSGAVLWELLGSKIEVQRIRCSDACEPLIGIWNLIKDDPKRLSESYRSLWRKLQSGEQRLYNEVRDRFNETGDPCDFFFLLRVCRVAAVEFSQEGKFITPYHLGELGLEPRCVDVLLADWHEMLRGRDVTFTVRDYRTVFARPGDFLYLDPPYKSERARLYFGSFDHAQFFDWLALISELEEEKINIERQIRAIRLTGPSDETIREGLKTLRSMMCIGLTQDDEIVLSPPNAAGKRSMTVKFRQGSKDRQPLLYVPIVSKDEIRAFLKRLGVKVYIYWQPRARVNKRGGILLDEAGQIVRSRRNFEVEKIHLRADFRPENVLNVGSNTRNHAHTHDTD